MLVLSGCLTACRGANTLDTLILALNTKVMRHEALAAEDAERSQQLAEAEQQLRAAELQAQLDASTSVSDGLQQQVAELTEQLAAARQEASGLRDELQQVRQLDRIASDSALLPHRAALQLRACIADWRVC